MIEILMQRAMQVYKNFRCNVTKIQLPPGFTASHITIISFSSFFSVFKLHIQAHRQTHTRTVATKTVPALHSLDYIADAHGKFSDENLVDCCTENTRHKLRGY